MALSETAYKLFGKFIQGKKYYTLQERLRRARMPASADVYMATALLSALLASLAGIFVGLLIGLLIGNDLLLILLVTLVPAGLGAMTYYLTIQYPDMTAGERGRRIDLALPYSIGFMHAMSRSGATVVDIFKELSTRSDVGDLQTEAQIFMRDVEYLGRDPLTSLRNLARTTPSEKFKSFLDVLISIVETGGDITPYFAGKTAELHSHMKEDNKKTVGSMEFMAEFYVILAQFLPLLFLAIWIFMGFLPGQSVDALVLGILVYIWVPLASIMFIIILATIPPIDIKGTPRIFRPQSPYRSVSMIMGDRRDSAVVNRLSGAMLSIRLRRFLSNPFKVFVEEPNYLLLISGTIGLLYLIFTPIKTFTLVFAFMIVFIPYAVAFEFRSRRAKKLETSLPDFLKSLSSASKSGLTLARALRIASTSELGAMTDEVRRAGKDIQWGSSANEALAKLEPRVSVSPATSRSITLIRKASEADENISEVVDITLNDVNVRREILQERDSAMLIYKMIIIMSFIVFLVTIYFIVDSYLRLPTGTTIGSTQIQGLDALTVKLLFYHMLLMQGFFGGMISGQMGGKDMRSGLKFSIILMLIAVLMFELVLMPKGPPVIIPQE